LETLEDFMIGTYLPPGEAVKKTVNLYTRRPEVKKTLDSLMSYKQLAVDIETTGLRFDEARVYSIAFATNDATAEAMYVDSKLRIKLLKEFFENYEGKLIYHNGLFDIKILVYRLFMEHPDDFEGMFKGIEILTKNIEDTMLMLYLTTNSTAGNVLGLKPNVHEYLGAYAIDVKHVETEELSDVLNYNGLDTIGTFYLYNKLSKDIITEKQVDIYENVFKPVIPVLLEMMLTGLPMDISEVTRLNRKLELELDVLDTNIATHPDVLLALDEIKELELIKVNAKLKKLVKTMDALDHIIFNPGSNIHKTVLFYHILGFKVEETTDTNLPSVSNSTLKKLLLKATPSQAILLNYFIEHQNISKILNTFLKAFINYEFVRPTSNTSWLNGNQKLGGTLSGRLASNEP